MYLYRMNEQAKSLEDAIAMDEAFYNGAAYDNEKGEFVNDMAERGFEQVAYWRKANMIHGWFQRNCNADNGEYYPTTRKQIIELLVTCEYVLMKTKLVDGEVHNGSKYENGKWVPIMEQGKVVEDSRIARALLPTCDGFFFGSTDYDEWYVHDLEETVAMLKKIIHNYDDEVFYYYPSW